MAIANVKEYGQHMVGMAYVAIPGPGDWGHTWGGSRWKVLDQSRVEDEPVLLLTLDLEDPRLKILKSSGLQQLPIASYINSDVWVYRQVYKICPDKFTVLFTERGIDEPTLLDDDTRFATPFRETNLRLEPLPSGQMCVDEDSYWRACDGFLGGKSFIRILGHPVWLQYVEEENCECGNPMLVFCSIGYENYNKASLLDNRAFFIGEGALYFFLCSDCSKVHVISQSS